MRYRYLARSRPASFDHVAQARRAAATAASTSAAPASATSASGSSVAGFDGRERAPVERLDELAADEQAVATARSSTRSRASGAGAYSQVGVTRSRTAVASAVTSVERDVVGRRRSGPVSCLWRCISTSLSSDEAPKRNRSGVQPLGAGVLVHDHEVPHGLLGGADAAGQLHADADAGRSSKSRTASSITSATGSVAAGPTLPVDVLMKSAPASHRQPRRPPHVVERGQLAGLEDHLEVGRRRRPP